MSAGERVPPPQAEERVTPLELFFDLVFVLSITQVTAYVSVHNSWSGLGRGMLILMALWWAWVAYAWLTNSVDAEAGLARVVVFAAMAAMLVVALAVPHAFGHDGLLFGVAYLFVRLLHVALYEMSSRGDPQHKAVLGLAPYMVAGPALILLAGAIGGSARIPLWIAALAVDYAGPRLNRMEGWRVEPSHFAERHGLIIIIALGESVVAVGVGAAGTVLGAGEVAAALLGVALVAALWWAYFDVVAVVAERTLQRATGAERAAQARDAYSYLHLPMIAGIVLVALGIKATIHRVDHPLDDVPAFCLYAGFALYLLGLIGFRLRNVHSLNRQRLVAAALALAALPVALNAHALVALATITVIAIVLIAYEALRFAEARARVRSAA